jgi:hypothetical protein
VHVNWRGDSERAEPTCGASAGIAKKVIRDWTNRDKSEILDVIKRTQTDKDSLSEEARNC